MSGHRWCNSASLFAVLCGVVVACGGDDGHPCPSSEELKDEFHDGLYWVPAAGDVVPAGEVEFYFVYLFQGALYVEETSTGAIVSENVDIEYTATVILDPGDYIWWAEGMLSEPHNAYYGCKLTPIPFTVAEP